LRPRFAPSINGDRMRRRAQAVKVEPNFSSASREAVALTAEHAAARLQPDRLPYRQSEKVRVRTCCGSRWRHAVASPAQPLTLRA